MDGRMYHHSSGSGHDKSNSRFCHTILPFCSDTTVANILVVACDMVDEGFALEDSVVSVVRIDVYAMGHCHSFERVLCIDSVGSIKRDLVFDPDQYQG